MIKEKQLLLDELSAKIDPSTGFILASYSHLSANATAAFRERLVQAGGSFFAVKKRVFLKAAANMDLGFELSELKGHVALVISDENFISTTKELFKVSLETKEALTILGAHFDGKKCSPAEVKLLSELPTQDEMRAQFLGLLEAPMSQTLAVCDALLTSVVHCLENKCKKES